ncbi:E3 ubiquitin-protein ligase RNF183 isoform X1 [Bubalus bubalis]|uniref:E3 ubiquitin-protein ligase RNF183 isoform X1 n=3 Tax=Bubalus TaxID=9918 RepID=UPI000DBC4800|nr:E3 ubiquitin-protein ligase RNF183 isoform X1 [Bubalus bubalis]
MQMRPAHSCLETARQEQAEPREQAAGPLSQGGGGGGGSEEQDVSCQTPAVSGLRMAEQQGREPECPVCWNPFNNTFHTPKVLDCCHSFCVECLAHISLVTPTRRRLLCPLCRHPTVLASGQPVTDLPTDTAVLTLLRLEPHHVILEGHQLCLKDQPKSRYFLRQPRVYTLDLGPEPASQAGQPQDVGPSTRPVPIPSRYSLRECFRNPHFRIFAYMMAVILCGTVLFIFSIFCTRRFFWGVGGRLGCASASSKSPNTMRTSES